MSFTPSPYDPHGAKECLMSPVTRCAQKHAKARQRRRRTAQERLERDRRQAQRAAEALQQALDDLGLPEDLVAEIEGRLHSQRKLLGKIVGVMCPPLFGCHTPTTPLAHKSFHFNRIWHFYVKCFNCFYCHNSLNFKALVKPCISMTCV